MRFLITICFLSIVSCVTAQQKIVMESLVMKSDILQQDVRYSICLPPDYSSNKKYPVVYLLHGLGDNESAWLEYGRLDAFLKEQITASEIKPMIFVMPQGYRSYSANTFDNHFRYEDMFVRELVPFIDKTYATIADAKHRAVTGYSMGGFGALMLPLKHPDVFSVALPMSMSVRTDEQYLAESASGWDDQWGKIFGGAGASGNDRLTDYYKANSPFYFNYTTKPQVRVMMFNGDDEGTLSVSNEALHTLMRDQNFPHEYRVRNGGHEFPVWREALTDAIHFADDVFENKKYRGDGKEVAKKIAATARITTVNGLKAMLPENYDITTRSYPVLILVGKFNGESTSTPGDVIMNSERRGDLGACIVVFLDHAEMLNASNFEKIESTWRVRKGFRFRAVVGFGDEVAGSFRAALQPETFTAVGLIDGATAPEDMKTAANKDKSRTWFYIACASDGVGYKENGIVHGYMREQKITHEYRVSEGSGGVKWRDEHLEEILRFIEQKIHH